MTALLQIAFFASVFFGPATESRETVLVLHDGASLPGEVVSSTADSVSFKCRMGGQETTTTFRAAQLDPHSFYSIRFSAVANDANGLLELAKFAAEHRMFIEATAQYNRAKAVDPKLVESFAKTELPKYWEGLAERLLADAKEAFAAGDFESARSLSQDILTRFTNTKAADGAKVLVREIGEKVAKQAIENKAKSETGKRKCAGDAPCVISFKNGTVVTGQLLESTDDSVTFSFTVDGKEAKTTARARELDPASFYEIRCASLGDNAADHLTLGKFAASQGMYGQARMHYEVAKSLDPTLVAQFDKDELPKVREGIAARLLDEAKKSIDANRLDDANRSLSTILTLLFDTKAATEAKALADSVYREIAQRSVVELTGRIEEQSKEESSKKEAERTKVLGPVLEAREKGRKFNLEGLKDSQSSQSMQTFKQAAAEFGRALSLLENLAKDYAKDPAWTQVIESYRTSITEEQVDAYVNGGSIALTRTSIPEARLFANQAIAANPQSSSAQAFRARVEMGASSGDNKYPQRWRRR